MSRAVASSTNTTTHPERKSRNHVLVHVIIRKDQEQIRISVVLLDRASQY
ncbi:MAG: hypothetical protein ACJ71L_14655 [Nitrososphaeraceae archaeon]